VYNGEKKKIMTKRLAFFAFAFGTLFLGWGEMTSAQSYPASQCTSMGGRYASDAGSCPTGEYSAGSYLDITCTATGVCCVPIGASLPTPQACTAQTCVSSGGECRYACGTTGPRAGTCPSGQQCCAIPSCSGTCVGSVGTTCSTFQRRSAAGTCAVAGQSCCTNETYPACAGTCRNMSCNAGESVVPSAVCSSAYQVCCSTNVAPVPGSVTGPLLGDYQLLEQIPGSSNSAGRLNTYLEDIYRFAFWTVGIAVVFMLTIGGFMYLTSAGNTSRMESAKTVIFDAILGLVLALVAWLFLYVVNPNLVNLNLTAVSIRPISSTAPASTTGDATGGTTPPPTSSGLYTHAEAMAALANGISVSSSGNCSNQNNASCTSLEGIPAPVVNRINALRNASGCNLVITGGTETGHETHGTGRGSVDFREDSCLGNFLRDNVTQYATYGIAKICAPTNWQAAVRASCVEPSGSPHFHIQFSI